MSPSVTSPDNLLPCQTTTKDSNQCSDLRMSKPIEIPVLKIGAELGPEEKSKLVDACLLHGFFFLSNERPDGGCHMSGSAISRMWDIARNMFDCPLEDKEHVNVKFSKGNRGYFTSAGYSEINKDPAGTIVRDNKEGFFFGSDSMIAPGNVVPAGKQHLLAEVEAYMSSCADVCRVVMRAIAATGLMSGLPVDERDPDLFVSKYLSDPVYMLKLLKYPPQNGNTDAHTDYGCVTLLLPGDKGLQINVHDEWHDVPVIPNAFVINFGDLLSFWSKGAIKSTIHRVIYNSPDPSRYRFSIPFFMHPNAGSKIQGSTSVIDSYEYVLDRFDNTYKHRKPAAAQSPTAAS